ncbi:tape measure protein [Salmonella enterica]|nr:tape measure protein [Salmonella enterica subsp. enterica]EKE7567880.1 tape measure protein [Salmonella enterica]
MAGKQLKASVIVDLTGNLAQRARQFSQSLTSLSRRGAADLNGLGAGFRPLGAQLPVLDNKAKRFGTSLDSACRRGSGALGRLRAGLLKTGAGFDRMEAKVKSLHGALYGLMGLGASVYGLNRWFVRPVAQRERYATSLDSIYNGNKKQINETMAWAIKNAKDSTWGLSGVMQEFTSDKAFGMSDKESRNFITMLEDQGAKKGWDLNAAQGASLQLKQMYSRQSIMAADANLLTGYGINVYKTLADKMHVDAKKVRALGERGKLGPEAIAILFKALRDEAKGAQKNAQGTWIGLTSQMGDAWEDFASRVMGNGKDKGVFFTLKQQLKGFLDFYNNAQTNGTADRFAGYLSDGFATGFDAAKSSILFVEASLNRIQRILKQIRDAGYGNALDKTISGLKTTAKWLLIIFAGQKALRLGWKLARPTWRLATAPVRGWRNLRNRKGTGAGVAPAPEFFGGSLGAPLNVFVTNWPVGGVGGGGGADTYLDANGKRKRGPGRGRGRTSRVVSAVASETEATTRGGWFSRTLARTGGLLSKIPGIGRAGKWLSAGAGVLRNAGGNRWLSRLGTVGRFAGRLGGPALAAVSLAPVLLDDQATLHDKAGATGGTVGSLLGGAVGSIGGPIGTVAGAAIGSYLGEHLGGWLSDVYTRWHDGDKSADSAMPQEKQKGEATIKLELPPELRVAQSTINDSDMFGLNMLYSGSNYGFTQ